MKPSAPKSDGTKDEAMREAAAKWVVRQDRKLSPTEGAELKAWLGANPEHAVAFEQAKSSWRTFRELGLAVKRSSEPVVVSRAGWGRWASSGLAAAAAVALAFTLFNRSGRSEGKIATSPVATVVTSAPTTRELPDGSVARLRAGAEITEIFSADERRIRLVRGEAYFAVRKDPRPFLVEVGEVTVRAVGTAFAIRFQPNAVDVLVTEGVVRISPPPDTARTDAQRESPMDVGAGHQARIPRSSGGKSENVVVERVTAAQIASQLAWNDGMIELAGATIGDLVSIFSQHSARQIEIADPALASVKIGGRFPVADVDGFLRALEEIYDVKIEHRPDGAVVLKGR